MFLTSRISSMNSEYIHWEVVRRIVFGSVFFPVGESVLITKSWSGFIGCMGFSGACKFFMNKFKDLYWHLLTFDNIHHLYIFFCISNGLKVVRCLPPPLFTSFQVPNSCANSKFKYLHSLCCWAPSYFFCIPRDAVTPREVVFITGSRNFMWVSLPISFWQEFRRWEKDW